MYSHSPPRNGTLKHGRIDDRRREGQRNHYKKDEEDNYRDTSPRRRYDEHSPYQPARPKREGWDIGGGSNLAQRVAVPNREGGQTGPTPKRPVQLDGKGIPMGKMMKPFKADVKSMARAIDPSEGYVGQTAEAKEKLMERILDEYEFHGGSGKVSEAYIKIVVGKALIKYRHELSKLVDAGSNKPHDILSEF